MQDKIIDTLSKLSHPITVILLLILGFGLLVYYVRDVANNEKTIKLVAYLFFPIAVLLCLVQLFTKQKDSDITLNSMNNKYKMEKDSIIQYTNMLEQKSDECLTSKEVLNEEITKQISSIDKYKTENLLLKTALKSIKSNAKEEEKKNPKYKYMGSFSREGIAVIYCGQDKYGYIDKRGNIVVNCIFTSAAQFSNGMAGVMNDKKKWGYVNYLGQLQIKYQYDDARRFEREKALVKIGNNWVEINKSGIVQRAIKN